jgi:hypothetical protein
MFNASFYHGTIKKYVAVFGTLFNNIYVNRYNPNTDVKTSLKVPLSYGPKEKALARLDANPNFSQPIAVTLPRMGFEITTIAYDPTRKLQTINKNVKYENGKATRQYVPVPFNISFTLYVMVKNAEDGTQIIEQILPYFTPDWTPTLTLIPDLDLKMDIPIVLLNVTTEDTYEGDYSQRRALTWSVDFLLKGYLFGPVKQQEVIKTVDINFMDTANYDTIDEAIAAEVERLSNINIIPGLTANGDPTSNASLTIDKTLINANDNYGYITTKI